MEIKQGRKDKGRRGEDYGPNQTSGEIKNRITSTAKVPLPF